MFLAGMRRPSLSSSLDQCRRGWGNFYPAHFGVQDELAIMKVPYVGIVYVRFVSCINLPERTFRCFRNDRERRERH